MSKPLPEAPILDAALRHAAKLAQGGRLAEAEALCRNILLKHFDSADALLLLGQIQLATGRTAEGVASIRGSIQRDPMHADAHASLGEALLQSGLPQAALGSYESALKIQPELVRAHFGRANALSELQRPIEALTSYDQVLRLQPNHAGAYFNRGNCLLNLRRYDAAVGSYDRAIALTPSFVAAHNNRGMALRALRRADEALPSFDACLAIEPGHIDALFNRGCVLCDLQRYGEALDAFDRVLKSSHGFAEAHCGRGLALHHLKSPRQSIESYQNALLLKPDLAAAHQGLGDSLLDLSRAEDALASHDRAVLLQPDSPDALNSRANSLRALRRFPEAIASCERALRLDGGHVEAHCNRGLALLAGTSRLEEALTSFERAATVSPGFAVALRGQGDALTALGRHEAAAACYAELLRVNPSYDFAPGALVHSRRFTADWRTSAAEPDSEAVVRAVLAGERADLPFPFLSLSDSAAAQLLCARTFAAATYPPAERMVSPKIRYRHDRIRIAYVSADLREHAVTYLLLGVFEGHDRRRFETTAISLRSEDAGPWGRRIRGAFDRFVDASRQGDRSVAELLMSLEIDVAVDLTGFTDGMRTGIFAHRAAPIQVNYLGYPGTLGAAYFDYIVADKFVIPVESARHYGERVAYLPDCFQANDNRLVLGARSATRAEAGLPENGFVFCCFNNMHKINARMFDVWMRLLHGISGSVLWLVAADDATRANLRREASIRGVDPERLMFARRRPYLEYLDALKLADLFLDTVPFNAGTTASDSLRAGLPLITCAGEAFAARMAGSILRAAGLPELITVNLAEYEATALQIASEPAKLAGLRQRLGGTGRKSPLFDTDRFRRHLESAFEEMVRRHEAGEEPASFEIRP